jgi:protoporphyrin/coproporphyrin ferrochelatase
MLYKLFFMIYLSGHFHCLLTLIFIKKFSFVSEHIETLEEIDMEYKELALESGIENWGRVPALNCTSSFISDLANLVIEALPTASMIAHAKNNDCTDSGETDIMQYVVKMLFGSVIAFFLLTFLRLISLFKNPLF